jgi:hypothetical protein
VPSHLMQSKKLTLLLLLSTGLFGVAWHRLEQRQRAPEASGWKWSEHPRAIVIYYAGDKGCSCSPNLTYSIKSARDRNRDVLIIRGNNVQDELILGNFAHDSHVIVSEQFSDPNHFIRPNKTTSLLVNNGKVKYFGTGTSAPGLFEKENQ